MKEGMNKRKKRVSRREMVSADGSGVGILISPERRTVTLRMLKGTASRDGVESLGLADSTEVTPVRLLYRSNSVPSIFPLLNYFLVQKQERNNEEMFRHSHISMSIRPLETMPR